ncbi:MAG: hypothetical protein NTU83_14890 [Candidatus Hydrogenedentes bacterium]|nr:hypothetical protein [Candidatus Hydrogenedentota bacterium]
MSLPGYSDYQRREYCKDVQCPIQILLDRQDPNSSGYDDVRHICIHHCIHTTYEFHHWLIEKGYLVVRPDG